MGSTSGKGGEPWCDMIIMLLFVVVVNSFLVACILLGLKVGRLRDG